MIQKHSFHNQHPSIKNLGFIIIIMFFQDKFSWIEINVKFKNGRILLEWYDNQHWIKKKKESIIN